MTEQLYKIVNSPEIGREQMDIVAADVKKAEEKGNNGSSLALETLSAQQKGLKCNSNWMLRTAAALHIIQYSNLNLTTTEELPFPSRLILPLLR